MFRKVVLVAFVVALLVSGLAVYPVFAQEPSGGIVCDDATLLLYLLAELWGYSKNESTFFPPMDVSQFDLGENKPIMDAIIPVLADPEAEPLTDTIIGEQLIPVVLELTAESASLTQTEQGDITGEDPACKELRSSVSDYISAMLIWEYVDAQAEE